MSIQKYEVGEIIGNLKIIEFLGSKIEAGNHKQHHYICLCLIDSIGCKKFVELNAHNIANQNRCCGSYTCKNRFINLIGQKFGKLLVVGLDEQAENKTNWQCLCDCGYGCIVSHTCLTQQRTRSCGCINGTSHMGMTGRKFSHIRSCARDRNIDFNITINDCWEQFIKQNGKCALTGIQLKTYDNDILSNECSLDRIDSDIGYMINNIQWVHKNIQCMKMAMKEDEFINYCKLIVEYNKGKNG